MNGSTLVRTQTLLRARLSAKAYRPTFRQISRNMDIVDLLTATATELQSLMTENKITSVQLVKKCLAQIKKHDPYLKAVIATAPEGFLFARAREMDTERAKGRVRGPMHGIPMMLKDTITTGPALGLPNTCGALALVGSKPRRNARVVDQLLDAGAIILGKNNLSEWQWFRSNVGVSGWSGVGGQTQSAYVRGGLHSDDTGAAGHSSPGGSSTGSAVAASAGYGPVAIGAETMGSLNMPADRAALYTLKATIGLVPQQGLQILSAEADSVGPFTKSVADLADLMDVLVDPQKTKIPQGGYKAAVTGSWEGLRIGYVDFDRFPYPEFLEKPEPQCTEQMKREYHAAIEKLKTLLKVIKPVKLEAGTEGTRSGKVSINPLFEKTWGKRLEEYLSEVDDCKIKNVKELVDFNERHAAEQQLSKVIPDQDSLERARDSTMTDSEYDSILAELRQAYGPDGIDKCLADYGVDIILVPGDSILFCFTSPAGYPNAAMPLSIMEFNGRPFGMQMTTTAHGEEVLIRAMSAWEATFPKRQPPVLLYD